MSVLLAPIARPFTAERHRIGESLRTRMTGRSWRDDPRCPGWDDLAYLVVDHLDMTGTAQRGELVVAAALADRTLELFRRLWQLGFPIRQLALVDNYAADDNASMAADNSSAFNFRTVAGSDLLSQHALGRAIDLNPVENPWRIGATIIPDGGRRFVDRSQLRPGMIVRPGPVVAAFDELGWEWGGDWMHAFDDHHIVWR